MMFVSLQGVNNISKMMSFWEITESMDTDFSWCLESNSKFVKTNQVAWFRNSRQQACVSIQVQFLSLLATNILTMSHVHSLCLALQERAEPSSRKIVWKPLGSHPLWQMVGNKSGNWKYQCSPCFCWRSNSRRVDSEVTHYLNLVLNVWSSTSVWSVNIFWRPIRRKYSRHLMKTKIRDFHYFYCLGKWHHTDEGCRGQSNVDRVGR